MTNCGNTTLRKRSKRQFAMTDYDRLPADLRQWVAGADLPWSPRSVKRSFDRKMKQLRNRQAAIQALSELEQQLIAKDAHRIWGCDHPSASHKRAV